MLHYLTPMNVQQWLKDSSGILEQRDIPTSRLDAEVLVGDLLCKDRSWLHAHPEFELDSNQLVLLDAQIARRAQHEPLAYIRGKQEFYGREFLVTSDTLTPRPETETMIDLLKDQLSNEHRVLSSNKLQVVDVGTGSGCIVITAALELSNIKHHPSVDGSNISYTGLDVSKKALQIAHKNAQNLGTNVLFKHFDLLSTDLTSILNPQSPILILANLPYVPTNHPINRAAGHEPRVALFGGEDGLDYYRVLFEQLSSQKHSDRTRASTYIFTESLPSQHDALLGVAASYGFRSVTHRGFIQVYSNDTSS